MTPKRYIIPVFVPHLGCPHDCVFCNQRKISGALVPATAETVKATVEEAVTKIPEGKETELAFYGGSFTAIPADQQEELLGAALPFIDSGRINRLRLSTRPDCIDENVIGRLIRYKVKTVELGVQSLCPDVLEKSNRGHTPEDAERSAKMIKDAGIELILQMMTGLPGDTPEKSIYTASKICEMKPDGVRVYPTVIVRDTELFEMWKAGVYPEHTVSEAVDLCAEISEIFEKAHIPIIRMGLNPTEDLSGGEAVAGAYHPAFGELVQSKRYLEKERKLLSGKSLKEIVFGVAPGQISAAVGQKRNNIITLKNEFSLKSIRMVEADVKKGEVVLTGLNICK